MGMPLCRLRYRGIITLFSLMTIYIYYCVIQLAIDVYDEDKFYQVRKNNVRNLRTPSVAFNQSKVHNSTNDGNLTTVENIAHQVINCTQCEHKQEFSCRNVSDIRIFSSLGHGTTKEVFRGKYDGREMAVKMVTSKVLDVKKCLERKMFWKREECYLLANYKILKEILFVRQLQHPNILQSIGYCVRNEITSGRVVDHGVISVTELGKTFNLNKYSRLPWEQKMKTTIELLDLLDYFAHSPIGSLIMTDIKTSQFLVVGDKVKLGDMDDVSSEEKKCETSKDCYLDNRNYGIQCVGNICRGINSKFNLHYFNKKIFSLILKTAPSKSLTDETTSALNRIKHPNSTAVQIKQSLQRILLKATNP
ncbi:extracellular tyrosine-protein kinase PKDCC-like [Anneissia japonica]|uniref:extracellular tyrosine-protein kinase PKDCC-like n=1 Tax=Anneissia japonica TaxID=1529436 RepID=UPI0014258E4D|nr:extracellular tyrosine-protein kinase PKDCC-like [Anneissia japonica]XP_033127329.1 extracellular tyrosine-protein kinase PKDCC-like [Anneissia japonica]